MNYNYEERRYMIVMSIVISLLILSIVGVSLLLFLPRTPSNRHNTVNVSSRIARGGGFQSSLENADVWDGTSTTDWTGSGTEADPYLITKASQLAGLSTSVNSGNGYGGKYFKLMTNLDMAGEGYGTTTGTTTLPYAQYGSYNVGDTFTEGDYTYTVTSKTEPTRSPETVYFYYDYGYNLDENGEILTSPPYECDEDMEYTGSEEVMVVDLFEAREGIEEDGSLMGGIVLRNPVEINGQDIHMSGYEDMAWYTETDMSEGDVLCSGEYYWVYYLEASILIATSEGSVTCSYTYVQGKPFRVIGDGVSNDNNPYGYRCFMGNFDGNGYTIGYAALQGSSCIGLFGIVNARDYDVTIKNLNLIYDYNSSTFNYNGTFGGLCGSIGTTVSHGVIIDNVNIAYTSKEFVYKNVDFVGGLIGQSYGNLSSVNISNCSVTGFKVAINSLGSVASNNSVYFGGIIGRASNVKLTNCSSNVYLTINDLFGKYIGGIVGRVDNCNIQDCFFDGSLLHTTDHHADASYPYYMGGIVGYSGTDASIICNNLFQGTLKYYPSTHASGTGDTDLQECIGGILGGSLRYSDSSYSSSRVYNNIANCIFERCVGRWGAPVSFELPGGVYGGRYDPLVYSPNVWNSSKMSIKKPAHGLTSQYWRLGETTDANMKLASTYADWEAFDEHWIINAKINDGYPMLRAFVDIAFVTGFDGSGTEADPYLIKTHQDLLGMSNYYNNNDKLETDIYWQLANDIDVSVDANGLPIHFTPICYNKEFDGYFDGNGKTISGLLIDNQYAYTGLFGTIGTNHWVKNLTVSGNIYWDQAYAVGGVAGRVMAGGYLQNCRFIGNIIGVLNTKTSTECHGVVGNYDIGGAIDCSATYKDIKYAKIGGTTDSPTYTYYLYDWAQINTNLYDRKVA